MDCTCFKDIIKFDHPLLNFFISGTKIAQSKKFNDPQNSCNIMVATDAIGMGLNL